MFHKPFKVKSHTQLKGSEKKKFGAVIAESFPSLTEDDISALIPSKADITLVKVYGSKGEIINIYQIQKEPLFFKVDRENELYPSVYLLWKHPTILKTFSTHSPVMSKLMQGADLMLPGIDIKGELNLKAYGKFEKGKLVAVNTTDNACPFAVGVTAMSSMDMYMAAKQGKGVVILHIFKDHLWEMGSKPPLPEILHQETLLGPDESNAADYSVDGMSETLEETSLSNATNEMQKESKLTGPEAMDELFYYCFLKALKTWPKEAQLPLLTSNFYRLHMVNVCPSHRTLDIKKSSYKKLSKFLDAMKKKNLIEVKEFPKGVENITAINFAHEEIKQLIIDKTESCPSTEMKSGTSNDTFVPPVLEEVYQVSGSTIQFFLRNGLSKGDVLSRAEVRKVVTNYIAKHDLQRGDTVEVNPLLHEAVVGPKEGFKEYLRWDEIFSRLLGKMSSAVRITREGYVPIIRKGKLTPIEIAVAKRSGNKKVTLVYNLGTFGVDENEFAHQVQIGVAASTSVGTAENKPQGTIGVLVQGNQVAFIGKLLLETYNIPRKHIKGLELAQKGKK